ncbi:MAG: hypothetical protein EG824_00115 [Deltaproteobacteria bacterium]|nr:hypothetical protein [Deltaproteobacteria bacterium]
MRGPLHLLGRQDDQELNAFPSANEDIAEAGNCIAFERAITCVMHLMRALEVTLAALASKVGISKQNDWGSYIRAIGNELERRSKTAGARTVDEQFYSEAAVNFDHLKRAWRNPSMQVEKTYTQDHAEAILLAVKSFMSHIATKISE